MSSDDATTRRPSRVLAVAVGALVLVALGVFVAAPVLQQRLAPPPFDPFPNAPRIPCAKVTLGHEAELAKLTGRAAPLECELAYGSPDGVQAVYFVAGSPDGAFAWWRGAQVDVRVFHPPLPDAGRGCGRVLTRRLEANTDIQKALGPIVDCASIAAPHPSVTDKASQSMLLIWGTQGSAVVEHRWGGFGLSTAKVRLADGRTFEVNTDSDEY